MAVITPNTFNPLRRYVGVRLQQGVPIVDADENEREDVRQFELRAFLKWFVGNGIPEGNDGFRIEGTGLSNDFIIRVGVGAAPAGATNIEKGLRHVGRCLVDGLDVIIESDQNFALQPLHVSQTGSAARASALGVPQIQAVPGTGPVVAYLDVWNRVVMATEDPSLVHPGLGTESCARLKREWVVRVRTGTAVPVSGDADFIAGHSYYALATITRRAGDAVIRSTDVVDRRERRLFLPPATLITDLLGTNPADYRAGIGRPIMSLREAINALMRGEIPATPDATVSPAPGLDAIRRAFLFDQSNGIIAVWTSPRVGGVEQVFATRIDQSNIAAGFASPPQQVTSGVGHAEPHATMAPNGDLIVTYRIGLGATADIVYKRAPLAQLGVAPEQVVVNVAGGQIMPMVLVSGSFAVFFFFNQVNNRVQFRRLNLTTNAFVDPVPLDIPAPVENATSDFHAATDAAGLIWIAFRTGGGDIRVLRLNPTTITIDQEQTFNTGAGALDFHPFVLASSSGIRVFWGSNASTFGLTTTRHDGVAWQPFSFVTFIGVDEQPCAVEDAEGGIWLFWRRPTGGIAGSDIFFMRMNPATGTWGAPRQMTTSNGDDSSPFSLMAPNNTIWVFWASDRTGDTDVYFKRIVTTL